MTAIHLTIEGTAPNTLDPFEVTGTEAISAPYSFDIACDLLDGAPPGADIIGRRATLEIEPTGARPRTVHGIIESARIGSPPPGGRTPTCRFRLVPQISLLRRYRQSQLFGTTHPLSVAEFIAGEMAGTIRQPNRTMGATPPQFPHELRLQAAYPPLDHLGQYEETNFDFLARLAERWGIFWFFENQGGQDQVIFADGNISCPYIDGARTLDWHAWSPGSPPATPETVQQLDTVYGAAVAQVALLDANYRTPHVDLLVTQDADPDSHGIWAETAERFLTRQEGSLLARIRAEEIQCRGLRMEGRSMVARLAAGHVFDLRDHPIAAWNQPYLIVSVQHHARVARQGFHGRAEETMGYSNTFTIQPLSVPFRPERRTPLPRLSGLIQGRVEGDTSSTAPLLDDQGRYKVRLAYDLADSPQGQASRWVRLATPFGGDGDGFHFPLHPGTDVMVAHVNGDPDRPVIIGTVPNPATPSVVTGGDASQNRIRWRSGIGLDARAASDANTETTGAADDGNQMRLWVNDTPSGVAAPAPAPSPYQWLRLGEAGSLDPGNGANPVSEGANAGDGFDLATGGIGRVFAGRDLFLIRNGSTAGSSPASTANSTTNRLISIIDDTMLLAHDGDINIGEPAGNSGYPNTINLFAKSGINMDVGGGWNTDVRGNLRNLVVGAVETIVGGLNITTVGGINVTAVGGENFTVVAGGNFAIALLTNVTFNLGFNTNCNFGPTVNFTFPGSIEIITPDAKIDIDGLRARLAGMDTEISDNKASIHALGSATIDTISTQVAEVQTRVNEVQTALNSVNTQVNELSTAVSQSESKMIDIAIDVVDVMTKMGAADTEIVDVKLFG